MIPWILNIPHARILLIGCQDPLVANLLAGLPTITLGGDGTTRLDLEAYALHVVQSYVGSEDPDEDRLVKNLVKRSENVFQYMFLVKNLIPHSSSSLYNREGCIKLLNVTPPGIFKMYHYYLAVQLQRIPKFGDMQCVLEILLQLLTFSPSPVTPLIFLQVLQSRPSLQTLELKPETDNHAIRLAQNAAGILFDVRSTTTGLKHVVPVHRTLSVYFLESPDNLNYDMEGISQATRDALVSLHNTVRTAGPESLLEFCCDELRQQDFNEFLHQYQYSADVCRQSLDDTSTRGFRPNISRQRIDRERLQRQFCWDPAFSISDSLKLEPSWMERQWSSLDEDNEWCRMRRATMEDYPLVDEASPSAVRIEISRWREVIFPRMSEQLKLGQMALSELNTRHFGGYAFR